MLRSYKSKDGIQFHDVREKDWFHDAVVNAARNKWMTGTSRKSFSPYRDTTRGMVATVLWRMEQEPESASGIIKKYLHTLLKPLSGQHLQAS